jgi:pimeloyl-ACP methyl ester carboxylesterase
VLDRAVPRAFGEGLAERLEVPDVGHLLMVADPETVADGLHAFVARHPVDRAAAPAWLTG